MGEINKDLIRWKRGQWLAATGIFFALQISALLLGSQKRVMPRSIYPAEPVVTLPARSADSELIRLENPLLFAAANWNGFSADAWLRKPEWQAPKIGSSDPFRFLGFAESQTEAPLVAGREPFVFVHQGKPEAPLPPPREPGRPERKSQLRVEGLAGRQILSEPRLPEQSYSDILGSTVVEALVGGDGLIISARIVENSGSAKADAEALAITRAARFSPKSGQNQLPEVGKLLFQWHALNLGATNGDANSRSNNVLRSRQ
jgi:TonB family protein